MVTFARNLSMAKNGKIISKFSAKHLLRVLSVIFVVLAVPFHSLAQARPKVLKNLSPANIKDTLLNKDTITAVPQKDTLLGATLEQRLGIRISKDALANKVVASASDSAVMDIKTNQFSLYGAAKVDYDGRKLSAPIIELDQKNNIATATDIEDSTQGKHPEPTFEQGSEKFTYDYLQYNFQTQRAIVHNAKSQYGEGFVHSEQIKRNEDKSLYGYKNVYTTCALDHPHFGIRTNRIKIIPEQAIATGSANIEIEGVPTPLFFPFGYFPINNETHRSGFILPGYTVEQNRGIGLLKGGYYFHVNDYVDAQLQADYFTKGSMALYLTSNYAQKYHYNGNLFLSYAINKTGEEFDPLASIVKTFAVKWTHNKDAKSLPGVNFNANINIQSNNYYAQNSFNTNQILQNQFSSNITFSKNWLGKPFALTASATHNQNTANKQVNVSLPDITFFVNARNPFQRKNPVGAARWYEKITLGYTMRSLNRLTFYDTAFQLNNLNASDFHNGMSHNVPISANYNVLRFITLSFNANYNEYWNTSKTYRAYNDLSHKVDTTIERGFAAARDFNAGFTVNTQIYGMKMFKKGAIKGIRHVIRPSLGVNYRPDFARNPFNYYYNTRLDTSQKLTLLSPYEQSIVGLPPQGRNGAITFALNNNLQMKVRNDKDSAKGFKNIVLLDALDFNTSYNLAADSFQWDYYRFSARTNIVNLLNISAAAVFDPYQWDYVNGRRTAKTMQSLGNGLARLSTANLGLGASFRSKAKGDKKQTPSNALMANDYNSLMRNGGYYNYVDFNIPWTLNVSYALNLTRTPSKYSLSDSPIVTQTINLQGDINFTPRWKVAFSTGYNVVQKQITFSSIDIYRDLHCWEMRLGLIPFGVRKSFNFSLNVKAQVLHDMRLIRRRDFRDAVN